jgi:hypothetical protein
MNDFLQFIAWLGGILAVIAALWWAIDTGKFDWTTTQYDNQRVYCKKSGGGYRLSIDLMHDTGRPLKNEIEELAKDACDLIEGYPG